MDVIVSILLNIDMASFSLLSYLLIVRSMTTALISFTFAFRFVYSILQWWEQCCILTISFRTPHQLHSQLLNSINELDMLVAYTHNKYTRSKNLLETTRI